MNAADDYAIACKIRTYIEAARKAGTKSVEWIVWASAKADWYDPTVCAKDPYFGVRDHEADAKRKAPEKEYW